MIESMKRLMLAVALFAGSLCASVQWATDLSSDNVTIILTKFEKPPIAAIRSIWAAEEGFFVSVKTSTKNVSAFRITASFVLQSGRVITRSQTVPLRTDSDWTWALFQYGKTETVASVSVEEIITHTVDFN